jgi:hypothetical protein
MKVRKLIMNSYYGNSSYYGNYRTRSFTDIFPTVDLFKVEVNESGIPVVINDANLTTLYYLLYSRYGNSHIANSDENQFKYKLYSIIFANGTKMRKSA